MTVEEHPQKAIQETCDLWDTLITFLTIEFNNLNIQTLDLRVTGTALAIIAMFFFFINISSELKYIY